MTTSATTVASAIAQIIAPEIPIILSLIFGGCCSNVFSLEVLVTDAPKSGNLVTLAQFIFVSLEGMRHQIEWKKDSYFPSIRKTVVPISNWIFLVVLFFLVSVLNNLALGYHISVPLHIIFRSGGLIVNMILGAIILKKRYSIGQTLGVICVTIGVILATLDNASSKNSDESSTGSQFITGIILLVIAMVLSAGMGLFQEVTYKKYGKQWREGLFYTHFLALPFFLFFFNDIASQIKVYNESTPAPLTVLFEEVPVLGNFFSWLPNSIQDTLDLIIMPKLWAYLILNMITQYVCIAGVNRMTATCSSLTLNLVLNLRKFTSLLISIVYFENDFGPAAKLGTLVVIFGTMIYTYAGITLSKKQVNTSKKAS
ncbi:unnamed protein product [Cunninghamella blakesleeana]